MLGKFNMAEHTINTDISKAAVAVAVVASASAQQIHNNNKINIHQLKMKYLLETPTEQSQYLF